MKTFNIKGLLVTLMLACPGGLMATAPTTLPDPPKTDANSVISLYGYYNDVVGLNTGVSVNAWWLMEEKTGPNGIRYIFKPAEGSGALDLGGATNISGMTHLHVDLWAETARTDIELQFQKWGSDKFKSKIIKRRNPVANEWIGWDIPLSEFEKLSDVMDNEMQVLVFLGRSDYYITNTYLYNADYDPGNGPQTLAPMPRHNPELVLPIFNDQPYNDIGIDNDLFVQYELGFFHSTYWNSTSSKFILGEKQAAEKMVFLSPQRTAHGIAVYEFNTPLDLSGYDYVHMDIWPEEDMPPGGLAISLYETKAMDKDELKSQINLGHAPARQWKSYDLRLSAFSGNVKDNLSALKQIRFDSNPSLSGPRTYYADNIYFYNKDQNVPEASAALPAAVRDAGDVISVFSDSYDNRSGASVQPALKLFRVEQDNIWQFDNTDLFRLTFGSKGLDVQNMDMFHLDIWTKESAEINVVFNQDHLVKTVETKAGEWLGIDIELPQGVNPVKTIDVVSSSMGFYVDNIYFSRNRPAEAVDIFGYNSELGRGINLGDIFEFEETARRYGPEYMKMIADLGFSHVRLPVRWEDYGRSLEDAPYTIDAGFMRTIQGVVDAALENNLKIIVNMHHHDKFSRDPEGQRERFVSQWEQIAGYFRYYPNDLSFEVFNEPYGNPSWNGFQIFPTVWNEVLVDGLKAIRKTNPNRPVLIGVAEGGGLAGVKYLQLPREDRNLILTVHYYSPHEFTHQGAEWSTPVPPVGVKWWDTQEERDAVALDFGEITKYTVKDKRPVHIGEFGVLDKADMDSRVRWTTYMARYMEQQGYSWAYWEFDNKFGIYDPVNKELIQTLVDALLHNPMPEPKKIIVTTLETLYDSNSEGTGRFDEGYGYDRISHEDNSIVMNISDGKTHSYSVQQGMKIALRKGYTYHVTFTAWADIPNSFKYYSYFFERTEHYPKFSQTYGFDLTTTPTEYSYTFTMQKDDNPDAWMMFDFGGSGKTPITITLRNIKVERVETRYE